MTSVGFLGMTHLGIISAAAVAAKGFPTLCLDPDPALIARLSRGELPVSEPGLAELIAANSEGQRFTADWAALAACDVLYVAPDVPTDDDGVSDLSGIQALIDRALGHLAPTAILVVLCQVPPGFTRKIPLAAGRLYYQVETLVFGRAVERAMQPERYIVGCADPAAPLPAALSQVLAAFGCPILPMRYESAELAKISINMCLVASIGVANTMAEVCEHVGADWSEIVPSLKLDKRIGPHSYLAPGLGIAGGNLERDLATVLRLARDHGTDAGIVAAEVANSRHRRDWAAAAIRRLGLDRAARPVAVWGLAYKEDTHSVKNSPSLHTLSQFPDVCFQVHDPAVPDAAVAHLGAKRFGSPLDALAGAGSLLILTPWPAYRTIAPETIARHLAGADVIDPYRVLDAAAVRAAELRYHTLGVGEPHA